MQNTHHGGPAGGWAELEPALRAATAAGDWLELARLYGQAEQLAPRDYRLAANHGDALWLADAAEAALVAYRRAALLAPRDPVVLRGLGNVHCDRNAFEAAERAYRQSWALAADPVTAWNHSQVLIGLERYAEGYALAEQRWQLPGLTPWRDPAAAWRGEAEGWQRPLLVWSEQGLGDTIQHLRWLGPLLARRGAQAAPLRLELEAPLVGLVQAVLYQQACLLGVPRPQVVAKEEQGPEPWADGQVSLLSLPQLLGGAPVPEQALWLQGPGWFAPSAPRSDVPRRPQRVGLVWAAGRKLDQPVTAREYRRRSLDSQALGALLEGLAELGIACELLQFGPDREQAAPWRERVAGELEADADFLATAERVAALDLVISVDTAMAHLVGAMGKPGWLLLPFSAAPRWLRERRDTPWYPSLRLFRQPRGGDWPAVVQQVLAELAAGVV